jgi:hypothetical protein
LPPVLVTEFVSLSHLMYPGDNAEARLAALRKLSDES